MREEGEDQDYITWEEIWEETMARLQPDSSKHKKVDLN